MKTEAHTLHRISRSIYEYKLFETEALKQCGRRKVVSGYQIREYLRFKSFIPMVKEEPFIMDNTDTPLFINVFVSRYPKLKDRFKIKKKFNFSGAFLQEINKLIQ